MTDQELQQLAREYANKHLTSGCFNVNGEPRVDVRDLAYFYETLLSDIAKTHCIVSREMIMAEYADAKAKRDLYMSATCINTIESRAIDHSNGRMYELNTLFGKSTFEEKTKEI